MRGFLASSSSPAVGPARAVTSLGVTCAAALALPFALPAAPATARSAPAARPAAVARPAAAAEAAVVPGSTQSLPLTPLARSRGAAGSAPAAGLYRRNVHRFSLLGVVWDDPDSALRGRVRVRTRATATGAWSAWQDVETHSFDHAADPGTAERASHRVRGATAPLWVGDSDGVEVRVQADARAAETVGEAAGETAGETTGETAGKGVRGTARRAPWPDAGRYGERPYGTAAAAAGRLARDGDDGDEGEEDGDGGDDTAVLPSGLSLELVDPGDEPATDATDSAAGPEAPHTGTMTTGTVAASAANTALAPLGATVIPALGRKATERELLALRGDELTPAQRAQPYIGPRPRIVTRRGWGADESLREKGFVYTKKVKAAFVHHTASGNNYTCAQAPSVIRSIYRYHVRSMGWRDIGYNFLIDKCGNIYEGRAGGVAKPVMGAHTLGFNSNTTGIAVIGSFASVKPPAAAVTAIARLTAWKLGLHGMNPRGKTYLTSGGGNLYRKGKSVRLNVISGHRDGYATECPGRLLYGKLGTVRTAAARYQGR
ncbi:peptidoglycan recognition protein [Streptomyces echinoruber]|uniref:N-acetylmuramoyl-L-alanine amidase n=1 Tax=Streptomyces echinoruber TaxID=68898 RepID=A0A918RH26_9ACTN|nr:peptidoglycan recognition protein [Streptomyces echinoruber]GGZ98612.1 hypothetical protein GCM10010389_42220 [Streptomyces echinoruber]